MKRNTIIKVMSASILAASLTVVDFPTNLQKTKYIHAVGTQAVSPIESCPELFAFSR